MDDFIFGTLATDELRQKQICSLWAGVTHNHHRSPRDPLPGQPIQLELTTGPAYPCDRGWVYWTTDGSDPQGEKGIATNGFAMPLDSIGVEWNTMLWGYVSYFQVTLPAQPENTLVRYCLSAYSNSQSEIFADGGTWYAFYVADDPVPYWAWDAVVYHIFVDRFNPGKGKSWLNPANLRGFFGGKLRGVYEKLDYLSDLGINTIYLSPIFPSPSHHGYDATNYLQIEPRLGTMTDFNQLVAETHRHQMRVLLDFVPNHCSIQHPVFQEAVTNPDCHYREWFSFKHYPDQYESFFGVRELPQFNLRNPGARQYILDAARYWLELGVDGYRLDYALGPAPDFWADFRRVTRTVKADCWTFGEVVDPPDVQLSFEGGLDGCLDFVLLEGLRQAFAFGRWNAHRLGAFLDRHEAYFPRTFSRPSFLDNHDMNRFLWAAKGDQRRLRLAALCQFTLAGPPIIYYGTEVGLSQERDVRQGEFGLPEESRMPMLWEDAQEKDLLNYYKDLIYLRRQESCLRRGLRRMLYVDKDILAYSRVWDGDELAICLNLSRHSRKIHLAGNWKRLLLASEDGCQVRPGSDQMTVSLPSLAGVVVK